MGEEKSTFTKQDIIDFFDDLPEKMKDSLREPYGWFIMVSDYIEKMPYFCRELLAKAMGHQILAAYKRFDRDSAQVRRVITWMVVGLFFLSADWMPPWNLYTPDDVDVGASKAVPLRQPDYPISSVPGHIDNEYWPRPRRTRDDF